VLGRLEQVSILYIFAQIEREYVCPHSTIYAPQVSSRKARLDRVYTHTHTHTHTHSMCVLIVLHMCPQVSSRKARLDRWGIPIGAGEGVTTSRSEHVAGAASTTQFTCFTSTKRTSTDELQRTTASRKYQQKHRERGITGAQAREALGGYFRQLVAKVLTVLALLVQKCKY
jgi:hypothetical protein